MRFQPVAVMVAGKRAQEDLVDEFSGGGDVERQRCGVGTSTAFPCLDMCTRLCALSHNPILLGRYNRPHKW